MTATITPIERQPLPSHETIPLDVREKTQALSSKMGRISRVLTANAALPEMRRQAKDDLAALAKDALNLWAVL